jgi:protein-disulfide isomerase
MRRTGTYVVMVAMLLALKTTTAIAGQPGPEGDAVAVIGGVTISRAQLDELSREPLSRLRSQQYEIEKRVLDQHVERLLFEQEAAERKLSVEELTRAEVEAKAKPVSEDEARAYYEGGKDRFKDLPEAQALQQITDTLRRQRVQRKRAEFVAELKTRRGVRVLLDPPRMAIDTTGAPFKGGPEAPVTIVEFSDFQCPYCSSVVPTLKAVAERYGSKVRIVFRDFPLPFHKEAAKASEAAACAEAQGRFWDMHDKLFANQKSLQVTDLKRYAREIGLDHGAFDQCLDSGLKAARWQRGREDGNRYGVNGTPSFFVNGRFLTGAVSVDALGQVIDQELQRATSAASAAGPGSNTPSTGRPGSSMEVRK